MVLSISLDEFIRSYSSEQNGAIVDLANFLVFASGLRKVREGRPTAVHYT